jgi:hypothetical protein
MVFTLFLKVSFTWKSANIIALNFLEYSAHPGAKTILYPKRVTGPALSRARERQY